jgi:hypothetical protein
VNIPLAAIHITTPLGGLGLALFSYALALVISLLVALIMWILVRVLGREKPTSIKK